ncbi:cutinase family protein, partial [Mycobacterium tuberculosis]
MVTTWALLFAPVPAASADPPDPTVSDGACPDVEVVFARGTGEPPGVGGIGEDFIDALREPPRHVRRLQFLERMGSCQVVHRGG